jgi:hypothetical protein
MKQLLCSLIAALCLITFASSAFAEGDAKGGGSSGSSSGGGTGGRGIGLNVGGGFPFLAQAGVDIYFANNLGVSLGYGTLSVSAGTTSVDLAMPEALLRWHPLGGIFFVAAGLGQETMKAKGTDKTTSQTVEINVTAMTAIGKLGWMWGSNNGGFWFGMDLSYIKPSGAKTDIKTALPTNNTEYKDAVDQAKKFGEMAYFNITLARFGWMF